MSTLLALCVLLLLSISCPVWADPLQVHVVAHTHDDVGWLKTVDEYFVGANDTIYYAGVQYILDSVVQCLSLNPARKFIYVEIAYFWRWWNEQTEVTKDTVRTLVKNGQLEFINGGWCMNDEGAPDYESVIDQMTFGHQFLLTEFGVRPRIGWHVDPFGHSATQASLFAQMGFDAFFVYRIDYQDWLQRNTSKNLEFVWRGSESLGASSDIWTHVLDLNDGYCTLPNFDFETGSTPVQDDPNLEGYNVQQIADDLATLVRIRSASWKHNHVLVPFGCDFRYQNANMNFKNIDRLIAYINANPDRYNMSIFYSTPSLYYDAVNSLNLTWTLKTDDFFPYSQFPHSYWTGFFTSRPTLKGFVRSRKALYHATTKILTAALGLVSPTAFDDSLPSIAVMQDAFGIAQHHDAVSGTAKQHVTDDYELRLQVGTNACTEVLANITAALYSPKSRVAPPAFAMCPFLNQSMCPALAALPAETVAVVMYNSLAWQRNEWVILYGLPSMHVQVLNASTAVQASQVAPNKDNSSLFDLVFKAAVPPLGYATYFLQPTQGRAPLTYVATVREVGTAEADITIQNPFLAASFASSSGLLSSLTDKVAGYTADVEQGIWWYNASAGYNAPFDGTSHWNQASGAYMLRTNSTTLFNLASKPTVTLISGPLYQEVRQVWTDWGMQVVRLYADAPHLVMESTIGPIDISDNLGKEVISRFYTSLNTTNNGTATWFADSMGGEMQMRLLNQRLSFQVNVTEQIGGNYYPMDTAAYIRDVNTGAQLTWLTDRSRGCSAQGVGQLESELHRRLLYDDHQGVGEALNESTVSRAVALVAFSAAGPSTALWQRQQTVLLAHPLQLLFAPVPSVEEWLAAYAPSFAPLAAALPANVHLVTYQAINSSVVLLRLANILAASEGAQSTTIDLKSLAPPGVSWSSIQETTLTANQDASALNGRSQWEYDGASGRPLTQRLTSSKVTLGPLQIRTFLCAVQ